MLRDCLAAKCHLKQKYQKRCSEKRKFKEWDIKKLKAAQRNFLQSHNTCWPIK